MTSFLAFNTSRQSVVISFFLSEVSSNVVHDVKIRSLFISMAGKLIFFTICYKRDSFDLVFGHFLANYVLPSSYHGNSLGIIQSVVERF